MDTKFDILQGKVLVNIENINNKELIFTTDTGEKYRSYHRQDCYEHVEIEDICGDLQDLIGNELLIVEEIEYTGKKFCDNLHTIDKSKTKYTPDQFCKSPEDCRLKWTFYKLSTIKGSVTIRWYGASNGCYSESVDFEQL